MSHWKNTELTFAISEYLRTSGGWATVSEVAMNVDCSVRAAGEHLRRLVAQGAVRCCDTYLRHRYQYAGGPAFDAAAAEWRELRGVAHV